MDVKSEAWSPACYWQPFLTTREADLKIKLTHGGQKSREDHEEKEVDFLET